MTDTSHPDLRAVLDELTRVVDHDFASVKDWGMRFSFSAQSILRYRDALATALERLEAAERRITDLELDCRTAEKYAHEAAKMAEHAEGTLEAALAAQEQKS